MASATDSTQTPAAATAMATISKQAAEASTAIGKQAAEASTHLYNVTMSVTQGIVERFAGQGLSATCAREVKECPCPRMMLVCCTAIDAGGVSVKGLFTAGDSAPQAEELFQDLCLSNTTQLLPSGTTPQLVSAALKLWLTSLAPEPLLTYRLVPALTSPETTKEQLATVLLDLPPPNYTAFVRLLDTCQRIAANSTNSTSAAMLAGSLSPCLLWRDIDHFSGTPPQAALESTIPEGPLRRPLEVTDEAVFVQLLTHMIENPSSVAVPKK